MKLAEAGLPKGGSIGYEIFDKSDALGATSFVQNINHLRALEGELARTIRALDRVQAARVHLVLPERPLFARDKAEPSASIVLKVRGMLEPQQVRAIRHLVASAVNGLKPERVSIVDEAADAGAPAGDAEAPSRSAADLEAVFDVPVKVSAVLGRARMEVGDLLKLGPGAVLELDRKVGEAIDIYVNNRLVARGEVVLVEDKLGVTMTEIIKSERN
jgi:flagellar M-ring protein FliF